MKKSKTMDDLIAFITEKGDINKFTDNVNKFKLNVTSPEYRELLADHVDILINSDVEKFWKMLSEEAKDWLNNAMDALNEGEMPSDFTDWIEEVEKESSKEKLVSNTQQQKVSMATASSNNFVEWVENTILPVYESMGNKVGDRPLEEQKIDVVNKAPNSTTQYFDKMLNNTFLKKNNVKRDPAVELILENIATVSTLKDLLTKIAAAFPNAGDRTIRLKCTVAINVLQMMMHAGDEKE